MLYLAEHAGGLLLKQIGLEKTFYDSRLLYPFRVGFVFLAVLVSWVFFRAGGISDAFYIVTHMFTEWGSLPYLGSSAFDTLLGLSLILLLYFIQILQYRGVISIYLSPARLPGTLRWTGYGVMILLIAILGISSEQFNYFQF